MNEEFLCEREKCRKKKRKKKIEEKCSSSSRSSSSSSRPYIVAVVVVVRLLIANFKRDKRHLSLSLSFYAIAETVLLL